MKNYLIILSGGIGTRMNSSIPKQYIEIKEKPILYYTLNCFDFSLFEKIVIVLADTWKNYVQNLIIDYFDKSKFFYAKAGDSRQESVLNALKKIIGLSKSDDNVIIHDGARPNLSKELILDMLKESLKYDGIMPVLPVKDTIYVSKTGMEINGLLNRDELFSGQSPELFNIEKYYNINKNLSKLELSNIRGSSEIAFKNGMKIGFIKGDENNFKITTQSDLELFKRILEDKNR